MILYLARKLGLLIVVMFIVSLLTFLLINLLPGDPTVTILGPGATAHARAELRHELHLDEALPQRYVQWLGNIVHGDFGRSYINDEPVSTLLREAIPVTLELMIFSQILALLVGIPLGVYSAVRPNGRFDRSSTTATFAMQAIPSFTIGVLLVLVFAVYVHWFPATGYTHLTADPLQNIRSLFLPSLALALGSIAGYSRVLRSDMIATLQQDFIVMARAKGLSNRYILFRHAFRPSTFTMVTILGLQVGYLISGAFIIEVIFALPGLGSLTYNSIEGRDYLVVQGAVLVVTLAFVVVNFLVDVTYPLLDPRTRRVRAAA